MKTQPQMKFPTIPKAATMEESDTVREVLGMLAKPVQYTDWPNL